jgi:hypothetical protein
MTKLTVPTLTPERSVVCLIGALFALSALSGCSDSGNTGRSSVPEELLSDIPWANGAPPLRDESGAVLLADEPEFPPIGMGRPDPGSRPVDCAVLDDYEFAEAWIETFEPPANAGPDHIGAAPAWASYDDGTPGSFHSPGFINWYPGLSGRYSALWGMPADRIEDGPQCGERPNNWALHYKGGPFREFGGGVNHPLALLQPCPQGADFCPPELDPADEVDSVGLPTRPADGGAYAQAHNYWDLSGYDGIAFWARRGPEGPAGFAVSVADKHTSPDLARENQKFCKRLRDCRTECLNGHPCTPVDPGVSDTLHRCFDPEEGLPQIGDEGLRDLLYPRCGESACTSPMTFVDRDFDGGECRPYTFTNHESGEFCFSPDGDPPPGRDDRCGDAHMRSLPVGPDWQFYAIPFSELHQQNFGKRAPYLDLSSLATLTFAFPMGLVDIYIDNVTFYRDRK